MSGLRDRLVNPHAYRSLHDRRYATTAAGRLEDRPADLLSRASEALPMVAVHRFAHSAYSREPAWCRHVRSHANGYANAD